MLEVLIDTIFVICGGRAFQQTVGIPLGTKCAPLLPDLFPYSYAADFIKGILKKNEKKLSQSFNFTFRYIDDVLSLNNSRLGEFVDGSASYFDIHLEINSQGRLRTKLYEMISIFPFRTFHLYVATFQQHLNMEYISLR